MSHFALALAQLVITHVTVIDVEAGRHKPDVTVVVEGERIVSVAKSVRVGRDAQVVDGRGKYLIPGLWDMHVHLHSTLDNRPDDPAGAAWFLPRFTQNGITGVRSMFDNYTYIQKLRALPGAPRIVASGPILDGPRPFWPGSIACGNADAAREAVRKVKRDGVDFVKVYSLLPRDAFLAIAEEAQKLGLPVAGHLPNSVTAAEASDAGMKSMEHLMGIKAADPELLAKFVRNGTWQTPTLTVLRAAGSMGSPELMSDARLTTVPESVLQFWKMAWSRPPLEKQPFESRLQMVNAMHRAGVRILAGTDTPNPFVYPGDSLHEELALLVKAGLKPAEVLRAATLGAAEYLGMTDRLGTITPGKLADMVLLGADPFADISNTRRIEAVVMNGRYTAR